MRTYFVHENWPNMNGGMPTKQSGEMNSDTADKTLLCQELPSHPTETRDVS